MRAWAIAAIILIGALILGHSVFAMGGDYEINSDGNVVASNANWPDGLLDLINAGPVFSGHWVNADSEFFFLGDTASLNRFLKRASTLLDTQRLLVIHAGSERRSELWGDKKPATQYDWKVLLKSPLWGESDLEKTKWVITIDVWIDRNIQLNAITRPENIEVVSAGEVERFALFASGKDLPSAAWNTYVAYDKAIRSGEEKRIGDEPEIPEKYWTDPIKALDPVKVYLHRYNIVIVERINDGVEEGQYLQNPISSYAPRTGDDNFVFTKDRTTNTLNFKRTRDK